MTETVLYVAASAAAAADGVAALERADRSLTATGVIAVDDVRQRAGDADCVIFAETPTTDRGSHLLDVLDACGETPVILYCESTYGPAAARATEGVDGYVRSDGDRTAEHLADEIRWCCRASEPEPTDSSPFEALPSPSVRSELRADALRIDAVNAAFEATFGHGREAADRTLPAALDPAAESADDAPVRTVRERLADGESHRTTARYWTPDGIATFRVETAPVDIRAGTIALVSTFTDVTERQRVRRDLAAETARLEALADAFEEGVDSLGVAAEYLELTRRTGDVEHLWATAESHERLRSLLNSLAATAERGSGRTVRGVRANAEPVGLRDVVRRAWSIVDPADATLDVADDLVLEAEKERLCEALAALFGGWIEPRVVDRPVEIAVEGRTDGFEIALGGRAALDDAGPPGGRGDLPEALEAVADDRGWSLAIESGEDPLGVRVSVGGVHVEERAMTGERAMTSNGATTSEKTMVSERAVTSDEATGEETTSDEAMVNEESNEESNEEPLTSDDETPTNEDGAGGFRWASPGGDDGGSSPDRDSTESDARSDADRGRGEGSD